MAIAGSVLSEPLAFSHNEFKDISGRYTGYVIRITNKNQTKVTGVLISPFFGDTPNWSPVYNVKRLKLNNTGDVVTGKIHMAPPNLIDTIRLLADNLETWLQADRNAPSKIAEELRVYPQDDALANQILRGEYDFKEAAVAPVEQRQVEKTAEKTNRTVPTS